MDNDFVFDFVYRNRVFFFLLQRAILIIYQKQLNGNFSEGKMTRNKKNKLTSKGDNNQILCRATVAIFS